MSAPMDTQWIEQFKANGLLRDDFIPFRLFRDVDLTKEPAIAYWDSWFVNDRGRLQRITDRIGKELGDWTERGNEQYVAPILRRLHDIEEKEYETRVKSLSLVSLRQQRKLWNDLYRQLTVSDSRISLILRDGPIEILSNEIQERLADSILSTKKVPARTTRGKRPWKGSKKEFCIYIREQYNTHLSNYKSERDATFRLFKRFKFADKTWTWAKCYNLLKQQAK